LIGDIPRYEIDPQECIYAKSLTEAKNYCSMDKIEAVKQEKVYDGILRTLSKTLSADYYPISDYFCDAKKCSMVLGNTILYRDNNHLNIRGSMLIGKYLANLLGR
jgi:hypothetical protein